MINKSVVWGLIVAVVLGIALDGGAAQKQPTKQAVAKERPKMGGTLVFGLGKEFANPNPFIATSSTFQFVKETAYESLLSHDEDGRVVPNLAEAYSVSADGTAITLRLRKGVKFHNGKEMKADDVIWSANHVKEAKNGAFGQNIIKDVTSFDKIDEYTVKLTLERPSVAFLAHLANIRMLPIVPANSLQPGQMRLDKNVFVPGTGPFAFEQYQPGFDTVVKKFPDYWGRPSYLDKVVFRPITDDANRFNALRTGDVQMADRISPLDVDRIRKGEVKGIRIMKDPVGGYSHLIVNYLNPLFQKREMRQAITYAVDKQRIVDEVFFGHARKTDMMMDPDGIWGKAATLPPQKRDLAKAKTLLKTAGYSGQVLVMIGRKSESRLLESLQRMLGEAGIKVKVDTLESGVMNDRVATGKYDIYPAGGNVTTEPIISLGAEYYTTKVEQGRYSNPKVDQMLDKLDREFDEKKRLKIFKDLAREIYNDAADIPILYEFRYSGMLEKVQGVGSAKGRSDAVTGSYFKNIWFK